MASSPNAAHSVFVNVGAEAGTPDPDAVHSVFLGDVTADPKAPSVVSNSGISGVTTATSNSGSLAVAAGDLVLSLVGWKPYTATLAAASSVVNITGMATLGQIASGTVANGVGTGSNAVGVYAGTATAAGTSSFVVNWSAAPSPGMRDTLIVRCGPQGPSGGDVATAFMADTTTTGTTVSASTTAPDIKAGDLVIVAAMASYNSATAHTSQSLTVDGVTLGPITWLDGPNTTAGNDGALMRGWAIATAGASTGNVTYTATSSNNQSQSAVAIIRVRQNKGGAAKGLIDLKRFGAIEAEGANAATTPEGSASIADLGTVTASGLAKVTGSASLGTLGSIVVSGGPYFSGSAALSGLDGPSATGLPKVSGSVSLAGLLGIEVTGEGPNPEGSAELSGLGSIAVFGQRYGSGSGALSGLEGLSSTGYPLQAGTASLGPLSGPDAAGYAYFSGSAALTGLGTVTVGPGYAPNSVRWQSGRFGGRLNSGRNAPARPDRDGAQTGPQHGSGRRTRFGARFSQE